MDPMEIMQQQEPSSCSGYEKEGNSLEIEDLFWGAAVGAGFSNLLRNEQHNC